MTSLMSSNYAGRCICGNPLYYGDFGYYLGVADYYYCSHKCAMSDLEVEVVTDTGNVKRCVNCNELLEAEEYETFKVYGDYYCTTECIDEVYKIRYTCID